MELALEVSLDDNSICLIDTSLITSPRLLITRAEITRIGNIFSTSHLYKEIIKNLNSNQIILALYFLLNRSVFPPAIISQYLIDTGTSDEKSDKLALLIYNRKLEMLDNMEIDFENIILSEDIRSDSKIRNLPLNETYTSVSEIFNSLHSCTDIRWQFDSIGQPSFSKSKCINLTHLKEALFEVEDKKHIVIGLSVPYSSFLRIIASDNKSLLHQLSQLVPVGYRDKTSFGSASIENPQINQTLIQAGFKKPDYYGITESGMLDQIQGDSLSRNIQVNSSRPLLVPLFAKILK